jgi:hypothetical protein
MHNKLSISWSEHLLKWQSVKGTPYHYVGLSDDVWAWCAENDIELPRIIKSRIILENPSGVRTMYELTFQSDENALMFKMKWL